jgi:serine/threonine protein kinase
LNLVLKFNRIKSRLINPEESESNSTEVAINGGTECYKAPELFKRDAKFSRKADVFAAGVVFLELLTLQKPNTLWYDLYPGILNVKLPEVLLKCFSSSLDPDPAKRMHFTELLLLLRSQDGTAIKEMELGSPATRFTFDEVAADIRLMMPSSHYDYDSSSMSGAFTFSR